MTNNRTKPDWGEAIFSEHCVIMRPQGEAALADFIKYAIAVTRMHLQLARLAMPVQTNRCAGGCPLTPLTRHGHGCCAASHNSEGADCRPIYILLAKAQQRPIDAGVAAHLAVEQDGMHELGLRRLHTHCPDTSPSGRGAWRTSRRRMSGTAQSSWRTTRRGACWKPALARTLPRAISGTCCSTRDSRQPLRRHLSSTKRCFDLVSSIAPFELARHARSGARTGSYSST